jgi:transposase
MSTIGIDIGAYGHAIAVCRDGATEAERQVCRISADRAGFSELDRLMAKVGPIERVVMESSGHYWFGIASHLAAAGVPVAVVSPVASKYFAKRRSQRAKSDPADARTLAALAMVDRPRTRAPLAGQELREAARFAMTLVQEQARVCQRILRLVDIGFPELRQAYEDPGCASAIALLRLAPTARAAAAKRTTTLARARTAGGRVVGTKKAEQIQAAAKTTVAPPELDAQIAFEMELLIGQHDFLEQQITQADLRLAELTDSDVVRRLRTIPGVGAATAAALVAEIGDIFRFDDFDQLVAFAGVHAAERSSGKKGANPETSWHMAKTGDAYLRAALYRIALVGTVHNPVIRDHYRRKRAAGKSKMNALGHCMKKALAIVWGVWRSGHDFVVPEGIPS